MSRVFWPCMYAVPEEETTNTAAIAAKN